MLLGKTEPSHVDPSAAALTMAVALLVERVRGLDQADKNDLRELCQILIFAEDSEDERSAAQGIYEILDRTPNGIRPFDGGTDEEAPASPWLKAISAKLKQSREEAGLTQQELEQRTGLPQSHISRLENGMHYPSGRTLRRIAAALNKPETFFDATEA